MRKRTIVSIAAVVVLVLVVLVATRQPTRDVISVTHEPEPQPEPAPPAVQPGGNSDAGEIVIADGNKEFTLYLKGNKGEGFQPFTSFGGVVTVPPDEYQLLGVCPSNRLIEKS